MTHETPAPQRVLADLLAALSHDLRSTLSGASLTAGMMGMHDDAEVRGFSERLNRMVSKQTNLLDLAYDLTQVQESDASGDKGTGKGKGKGKGIRDLDLEVGSLADMLRAAGVTVSGDEPLNDTSLALGRPIGRALCMLLAGGDAVFEQRGEALCLQTTVPIASGASRSVPFVALAACSVTREAIEGATRFVLG